MIVHKYKSANSRTGKWKTTCGLFIQGQLPDHSRMYNRFSTPPDVVANEKFVTCEACLKALVLYHEKIVAICKEKLGVL